MTALNQYEEDEVIALIARLEKDRRAYARDGIGLSARQSNDWLFGINLLLYCLDRRDLLSRGIAMGAQDDTPAEPAGALREQP